MSKKVNITNCLAIKKPYLVKEWHPTKNGSITPKEIVAGSHKKYWFKCNKGHEWETHLNNRTGKTKKTQNGCPYCLYKTQEKVREIFERFLKKPFPKMYPKFLERMEFDGANSDLKLAFEYDGEFHDHPHYKLKDPIANLQKIKERDLKKDILSKENGWTLIRIHHSKKHKLESTILEELTRLNLI